MNFHNFIAKLQGLPDTQKKIILWAVVAILALGLGFLWFKITVIRLSKLEEIIK